MASVTSDHVVTVIWNSPFTDVTDRRPIHEMSLHAVTVARSGAEAALTTRADHVLHDFLLSVDGNGATVVKAR